MLSKPSYNPETVERSLANGRKFKETFNETRTVTVVQSERQDLREFEIEFGRELFYLKANINPQTDIDDEGYLPKNTRGKTIRHRKPTRHIYPPRMVSNPP